MSDVTDLKAEVLLLRKECDDMLERRIDELCADVEWLRNQLHDQQDTAEHNFVRNAHEYKRVCDENTRLRELCKDMYENPYALSECWECPHCGNGCISNCYYRDRLRELGIEVD